MDISDFPTGIIVRNQESGMIGMVTVSPLEILPDHSKDEVWVVYFNTDEGHYTKVSELTIQNCGEGQEMCIYFDAKAEEGRRCHRFDEERIKYLRTRVGRRPRGPFPLCLVDAISAESVAA